MRAYDIALFIAMLTALGGVVNDIGFLNEYELAFESNGYQTSDFNNIDGHIDGGAIVGSDESLIASDTKFGITSLLSAIGELDNYVLIKPIIMDIFAVKLEYQSVEYNQINNIANLVQTGCIFVYMFAIVQLWRKSSIKHME